MKLTKNKIPMIGYNTQHLALKTLENRPPHITTVLFIDDKKYNNMFIRLLLLHHVFGSCLYTLYFFLFVFSRRVIYL